MAAFLSRTFGGPGILQFSQLVVLNEKGNARVGGDLINAGSPKEGRFCKTKRLVVVDGNGSH